MDQSRRIDGLIVYGVIYLGFLYLPILLIPLFSFNDSIYIAFPLKGFTLQWYEAMIAQDALVRSLMNSLKVAKRGCRHQHHIRHPGRQGGNRIQTCAGRRPSWRSS